MPSWAMRAPCVWCRRPLVFVPGQGWIHEGTGTLYVRRVGPDGVERDDHCALPDMSESGT